MPLLDKHIERIKHTDPQANLSRVARLENVRGAFRVRREVDLAGLSIVIVDDVMTTGATVSSCAKALRSAGATQVHVWTFARANFDIVLA